MNRSLPNALLVSALLTSGCYVEGLTIENLTGTVIIEREAATRVFQEFDDDGEVISETEITDVALIGPVYVGLYPEMDYRSFDYPHPTRGPLLTQAYPYGGTTIGDIRYACLEFFTCRLTSNRFVNFDDVVDWFADVLDDPVTDAQGREVLTGEYIRQTCFDLMEVTSDAEIRVTAIDKNGDGAVDGQDLDFVENEDGDFEGTFEILQAEFYEGMSVWAFMDSPDGRYSFDSCNEDQGFSENTYNRNFDAGLQQPDILNRPDEYLLPGDWVATDPYIWTDAEDDAVLTIDFLIGTDEIAEPSTPAEEE